MQTEHIEKQAEKQQEQQTQKISPASSGAVSQLLNSSPRVQALAQTSALLNGRISAAGPRQLTPALSKPRAVAQAKKHEEDELRTPVQKKANNTGLPDNLKSGVESLSGISMDNVKVHYNSPQPAQLNALAYAQGADIHVAPGQEKHLPHEAWHVVQQAQGRVKPTLQLKEGIPVNDDKSLEHEADVMGAKAMQIAGNVIQRQPLMTASMDLFSQPRESRFASAISDADTLKPLVSLPPHQAPIQALGWPAIAGMAALGAAVALGLWRQFGPEQVAEQEAVLPQQQPEAHNIPQIMHFVWLGGQIPQVRVNNIIAWRNAMPHATHFRLWVDQSSQDASAAAIADLEHHEVQVTNIDEINDPRLQNAVGLLPTVHEGGAVNPPAAGALSDVVRLAALHVYGGTYMDSDNLPVDNSANLVGGPAPSGFRIGHQGGVMSNDAISNVAGSEFVNQYLGAVGQNLTHEQAAAILGGGPNAINAVMATTGPLAMAEVPLPGTQHLLAIAQANPDAGVDGNAPLTIRGLRNLYEYRELMAVDDRNAVETYINQVGMVEFHREQGNAWLPPAQDPNGA